MWFLRFGPVQIFLFLVDGTSAATGTKELSWPAVII
jgi:hypothetical protein